MRAARRALPRPPAGRAQSLAAHPAGLRGDCERFLRFLAVDFLGEPLERIRPRQVYRAAVRAFLAHLARGGAPGNINYGLFRALPTPARRADRRAAHATRAEADLAAWTTAHGVEVTARLAVPA